VAEIATANANVIACADARTGPNGAAAHATHAIADAADAAARLPSSIPTTNATKSTTIVIPATTILPAMKTDLIKMKAVLVYLLKHI